MQAVAGVVQGGAERHQRPFCQLQDMQRSGAPSHCTRSQLFISRSRTVIKCCKAAAFCGDCSWGPLPAGVLRRSRLGLDRMVLSHWHFGMVDLMPCTLRCVQERYRQYKADNKAKESARLWQHHAKTAARRAAETNASAAQFRICSRCRLRRSLLEFLLREAEKCRACSRWGG